MISALRLTQESKSTLQSVPAGVPLLSSEMFHSLGWSDLKPQMKAIIESDIHDYVRTLMDGEPINAAKEQRRRQILYWIEAFRSGLCTEQTAIDALRN
jgi:hypothetical protein